MTVVSSSTDDTLTAIDPLRQRCLVEGVDNVLRRFTGCDPCTSDLSCGRHFQVNKEAIHINGVAGSFTVSLFIEWGR